MDACDVLVVAVVLLCIQDCSSDQARSASKKARQETITVCDCECPSYYGLDGFTQPEPTVRVKPTTTSTPTLPEDPNAN